MDKLQGSSLKALNFHYSFKKAMDLASTSYSLSFDLYKSTIGQYGFICAQTLPYTPWGHTRGKPIYPIFNEERMMIADTSCWKIIPSYLVMVLHRRSDRIFTDLSSSLCYQVRNVLWDGWWNCIWNCDSYGCSWRRRKIILLKMWQFYEECKFS